MKKERRVVIVGGGFAGVKAALELSKKGISGLKITLVSDKKNFEYHGALYRFATGGSPLEVCFPIREIVDVRKVELVIDKIDSIDSAKQMVHGESGSTYCYDTLILALGSETNYFSVMGAEDYSFGMKTIKDALALKEHIQNSIKECASIDKETALCAGHFVVVGGGATGVEIAAEIIELTKEVAGKFGLDRSIISVDLVESSKRILPMFPLNFSRKIEKRLKDLGVNIILTRTVLEEEIDGVTLSDTMNLKAKTVIWTAGAQANSLYFQLKNADFNKQGKVFVDDFLRVEGEKNIFALGDGAATKYSGMAQTALRDAVYVANLLAKKEKGKERYPRVEKEPIYAIPVGKKWAGTLINGRAYFGKKGWFLRRVVDMVVFIAFLPLKEALWVFKSHGRTTQDTCR